MKPRIIRVRHWIDTQAWSAWLRFKIGSQIKWHYCSRRSLEDVRKNLWLRYRKSMRAAAGKGTA